MVLITMVIRLLRIAIVGMIFGIGGIVLMDLLIPEFPAYHPFLAASLLIMGAVGLNEVFVRKKDNS